MKTTDKQAIGAANISWCSKESQRWLEALKMVGPDDRRQIEICIEQQSAILAAIEQLDDVTRLIAAHDGEALEAGLASLLGTSPFGARAVLDCQFRRISPKNKQRLAANLELLKTELDKLS